MKIPKSVSSLLFTDETVPTQQRATGPTNPVSTPTPVYGSPVYTSTPGVDPSIRSMLLQAMSDNKLAGYDYLKFVAALEEMKTDIPSEATRFKTAFAVAKQLSVDKATLAKSGQHYIDVLNNTAKEFQDNLASKMQETVTSGEKRLQEIDGQIQGRQEQIAKLTAEIQAAQTERTELASKVAENHAKLDSRKQSFDVTHAGCVAEIEANIQKINQFLQ